MLRPLRGHPHGVPNTRIFVRHLPEDGIAKVETCTRHTVKWQTIIVSMINSYTNIRLFVDYAIIGLNSANYVDCLFYIFQSFRLLAVGFHNDASSSTHVRYNWRRQFRNKKSWLIFRQYPNICMKNSSPPSLFLLPLRFDLLLGHVLPDLLPPILPLPCCRLPIVSVSYLQINITHFCQSSFFHRPHWNSLRSVLSRPFVLNCAYPNNFEKLKECH